MVRTWYFHWRGPGVQSLVRKLTSHKPRGTAKKNKMKYFKRIDKNVFIFIEVNFTMIHLENCLLQN